MVRLFGHYVSGLSLVWLAGDFGIVLLVYWVAARGVADSNAPTLAPALILAVATVFLLHVGGMYSRLVVGKREAVGRIIVSHMGAMLILLGVGLAIPDVQPDRVTVLTVLLASPIGPIAWRVVWLLSAGAATPSILVIGPSAIGHAIALLEVSSARPFRIAGFIDDSATSDSILGESRRLGDFGDDLLAIVARVHPDMIVVAQGDRRGRLPVDALLECRLRGIAVMDWPGFCERMTGRILVSELRPSWLVFSEGFDKARRTIVTKRVMDVVLGLTLFVPALPLMLLSAITIAAESPGPVLFRQRRVGQHGRLFTIYKFRSMRSDAERVTGAVWADRNDARVTRIGGFLRRTRIDELPQLFNVLRGDMSFIGPRPERPEFIPLLEREIPFYRARLSVKPGITGWAQVQFSYGASVEDAVEKLQYDLYYVKNMSVFLDLLIVLNTIRVVLFARGR